MVPRAYEAICPNCIRIVPSSARGIILIHLSYNVPRTYDMPPSKPGQCPGVGHMGLKGDPETLDPPCYSPLRKRPPHAPVRESSP